MTGRSQELDVSEATVCLHLEGWKKSLESTTPGVETQPHYFGWSWTDRDHTATGWSSRASAVTSLLCATRQSHLEWEWTVTDIWCVLFDVKHCWIWRRWCRIMGGQCHGFSQLSLWMSIHHHAAVMTALQWKCWSKHHEAWSLDFMKRLTDFQLLLPNSSFGRLFFSARLAVGFMGQGAI